MIDQEQPDQHASSNTNNDLFAISVDADDYAETAAGDTPSTVSRTYQSDADFQQQKASYSAKIHQGNLLEELVRDVPEMEFRDGKAVREMREGEKVRLGKKEVQLLGYVVGEMYYDGRFGEILALCERVRGCVEVGEGREGMRLRESLVRWEERCRGRMEGREKES